MATRSDSLSVLHVDDDADLGALVKLNLERAEEAFDVSTETDPQLALERIRGEEPFDCVISDYNMPRMDGIELLDAVRSTHPELPFLLFSSEETASIAAEMIRAGLTDYLKKGIGSEQYTMLVRRVEHAAGAAERADASGAGGRFDSSGTTGPSDATPGESFAASAGVELDGVGVVGTDDRFDEVDETYAACYEYDPEEITGKHWTELHPDSEVEHIRSHVLPVVSDGGRWSGRSEGLRADGSTFTESKMVAPLSDGRLLIAVSELEAV